MRRAERFARRPRIALSFYRFLPALRPSIDGYLCRRNAEIDPLQHNVVDFETLLERDLRSADGPAPSFQARGTMDGRSICFRAAPVAPICLGVGLALRWLVSNREGLQ